MEYKSYQFEIIKNEGMFVGYCPDLDLSTQGETLEELYVMMGDIVDFDVSHRIAEGREIIEPRYDHKPQNGGYMVTVVAPLMFTYKEGLTFENAAKMLQLTPGRVSKIVRDGLMPMYVDPEGRKRIPAEAVKERMKLKPNAGRPKKEKDTQA